MINRLIISALFLFGAASIQAQHFEVGMFAGGSNFIGDVGNYRPHLPTGYSGGLFVRYNFNRHWALRLHGNYGHISNADSLSGMAYRQQRNLSFESEIWELGLTAEFNFLEFEPGTNHWHTPYLMGGFGIFSFNPMAEYAGEMYELRPLGTEGQQTSANNAAFYAEGSSFLLFGMGYKWAIGDFTSIGVESTFRSTATDYLDDVSGFYPEPGVLLEERGEVAAALSDRSLTESNKQDALRGNPANNDWYIFTGITLQFKFEELYEKCTSFVR